MSKPGQSKRSLARDCAFKAVYASQLAHTPLQENLNKTLANFSDSYTDTNYAKAIINSVAGNQAEIDGVIEPVIALRAKSATTHVEMSVITIATAELLYHQDTPSKVVINEAVELTKKYGADDGYKFVNGVLDKIHKNIYGQH